MNLFETVKSAVTVKQAAEYYGCKDGTIAVLEQRLQHLEKEVQHRGEEREIA